MKDHISMTMSDLEAEVAKLNIVLEVLRARNSPPAVHVQPPEARPPAEATVQFSTGQTLAVPCAVTQEPTAAAPASRNHLCQSLENAARLDAIDAGQEVALKVLPPAGEAQPAPTDRETDRMFDACSPEAAAIGRSLPEPFGAKAIAARLIGTTEASKEQRAYRHIGRWVEKGWITKKAWGEYARTENFGM